MDSATVIHGKFANNLFVPDEPPPSIRGRAELIVFPDREADPSISESAASAHISVFDLLGKAPVLRSGEEIDAQIESGRRAWDDE
ncbi:MAG: hypothetical protein WCJ35_04665 [Planctomycetota bacterium]